MNISSVSNMNLEVYLQVPVARWKVAINAYERLPLGGKPGAVNRNIYTTVDVLSFLSCTITYRDCRNV